MILSWVQCKGGIYRLIESSNRLLSEFVGSAIARAAICRPLTMEAHVRVRLISCGICCGQWHWDRFISEFFGFPFSVSLHIGSPYSYHLGDDKYN
jgi:hypothetical protein